MRLAMESKTRYIATQRHSKHRVFVWVEPNYLCNDATIVFARDDDYFIGILQSKLHEIWARGTGTQVREAESGFRYTPTTTFETFPFPWAPNQEPKDDPHVQAIGQAAKELVEQRDRWLSATPSAFGTSPKSAEEKTVKPTGGADLGEAGRGSKRTLTNLYNARPTWLELAHKRLDDAVFAAYGWKSDLTDEEILEKLLALNLERGK
jgi:hypothetical protein